MFQILLFTIFSLVNNREVTEEDFTEVNLLSTVPWDKYLPTQALLEAVNYQGIQLDRIAYNVSNSYSFTPTWVTPIVDTSKITILVNQGSGYADQGSININNSMVNFKIDFTMESRLNSIIQPIYGSLYTKPESINYTVDVIQNNNSITYKLNNCTINDLKVPVYSVYIPGFGDLQNIEIANELNAQQLLPQLINNYYHTNIKSFCTKMQFFVEGASIPSTINFKLDQYMQPSQQDPRVIESIETIKFQGLQFSKEVYTLGQNIEIFNFDTLLTQSMNHQQFENHLYSIEVSLELIQTYFDYAAENRMFNTILNDTLWPVSGFSYKTADLRKMIPTAYYSFKLDTNIWVDCKQTNYRFVGLIGDAIENNTIQVQLSFQCNEYAEKAMFGSFSIALSFDIAVEENKVNSETIDYINFLIVNYDILELEFQEISIFEIWSENQIRQVIERGLQENLPNTETYGSGWIKNELGNRISYGFDNSTLTIWSLQLL